MHGNCINTNFLTISNSILYLQCFLVFIFTHIDSERNAHADDNDNVYGNVSSCVNVIM